MKKSCILFFTLFIIFLTVIFGTVNQNTANEASEGSTAEYLRVHIRANSNSEADQAVKYKVRDALVEEITPLVVRCCDKQTAISAIRGEIENLTATANAVLLQNGYTYGARAEIRSEKFPTRVYEEYTLEAGVYDALIVELGAGTGDNWWCCIYPPLCFTGGNGNFVYRSLIAESIRKFFD